MKAQTIQIDSTFTADGEIFPFLPNDTIYGLSISGSVTLNSDTSLVRIILSDDSGNEWMVYEAYPMIVTDTAFEFEEECDETCYLEEFYPHAIEIQIIDAEIEISHLTISENYYVNLADLQYQAKRNKDLEKVGLINQNPETKGWNWIADENGFVNMYFNEKAARFYYKYYLLDLDFYSSGTYCESPADSIINILNFQPGLTDEYRKAFEYFARGDSSNAVNTLDEVPIYHDLTDAQENEYAMYGDYTDILFNPDTSGTLIFYMDSLQKINLYAILDNSNGILKAFARNILMINDSLDYSEPIILPQPGLKSGKVRVWPLKNTYSTNSLKIYPNPANNILIIECRSSFYAPNAVIKILNMEGIILQNISVNRQDDYMVIPLSDFKSGLYLCKLEINGKTIDTKKFIVTRF